jgi:sterol desaturase/sphingolipid hydroxylase (fatty acid hydroxylase superfamily)
MLSPGTEATIRLGFFAAVLLTMATWEILSPKRPLRLPKGRRWVSNLVLVFFNTLAARFLLPFTAVWVAQHAHERNIGLLNQFGLPEWVGIALAVVALDFIIYLQHVMFHMVPILWRLHRVHHADGDIDVTTGSRFHPVEILISMGIKFGSIYVLGVPPLAVVVFEVLLNATAMFNHSNVNLPVGLDRWLRWLVVTPDMHRVHHSILVKETNSNFGFNTPWWDRLCGTYRAQPKAGHQGMEIGLLEYRDDRVAGLGWMLTNPFRSAADDYSINARQRV